MAKTTKKNTQADDSMYAYVQKLETQTATQSTEIVSLRDQVSALKRSNAAFKATATRWKNRLQRQ